MTLTLTLTAQEARVLAVLVSANERQLRELEVTETQADALRDRLDAEAFALEARDEHFVHRGYDYAAGVMEPGIPVAVYATAFADGLRAAAGML